MKAENGKVEAKLRRHEQRTSNEVRTQFVPFGARTANDGKEENGKRKEQSGKRKDERAKMKDES